MPGSNGGLAMSISTNQIEKTHIHRVLSGIPKKVLPQQQEITRCSVLLRTCRANDEHKTQQGQTVSR